MITTAEDYYGLLYKVQDKNAPSIAVLLPTDEKIYNGKGLSPDISRCENRNSGVQWN